MNHYYRKKNDTAKACSTMWEPNHNNRFVILFSLSILVLLIGLERAEVGIVLMTLTPHRIPRLLSMNFIDPTWFRELLIDDGRFYYFRYWLGPIGKSLGIKSTKAKPPVPNKSLEDAYNKSSKLNHKTVSKLDIMLDVKASVCYNWHFLAASCPIFFWPAFDRRHWNSSGHIECCLFLIYSPKQNRPERLATENIKLTQSSWLWSD